MRSGSLRVSAVAVAPMHHRRAGRDSGLLQNGPIRRAFGPPNHARNPGASGDRRRRVRQKACSHGSARDALTHGRDGRPGGGGAEFDLCPDCFLRMGSALVVVEQSCRVRPAGGAAEGTPRRTPLNEDSYTPFQTKRLRGRHIGQHTADSTRRKPRCAPVTEVPSSIRRGARQGRAAVEHTRDSARVGCRCLALTVHGRPGDNSHASCAASTRATRMTSRSSEGTPLRLHDRHPRRGVELSGRGTGGDRSWGRVQPNLTRHS
jgi:hypothetical protein